MATDKTTVGFAAALWACVGAAAATLADPSPPPTPTPASSDTVRSAPPTAGQHIHGEQTEESPEGSRNLFQSDMTIMTGMTPRDPMGGMAMPGWRVMDMGVVRLQFNRQGGPSGREAFESTNWNMVHAEHDFLGGRFSLMMMNSLEPATLTRFGTPQIFQLGETLDREPLVDVQHPHDFFMNLSATYRHPLGADGGFWLQYAPVGEPALGPAAFMHRASSGENPAAPLGHHGQDSTHITFGVVTAGARGRPSTARSRTRTAGTSSRESSTPRPGA